MSNKYFGKATTSGASIADFASQLASAPSVSGAITTAGWSSSGFRNESYCRAGTDTTNVTLKDFYYGSTPTQVSGVKVGYLPTGLNAFATISTAGTYGISRSSSTGISIININNNNSTVLTVPPSKFRDGVTPSEIVIVLVGGGGGAGGRGSHCNGKDDFSLRIGGAGGGGGVGAARIDISGYTYNFTVGAGGTVGSSNTTSSGKTSTTGATGGSGGNSVLTGMMGATLITARGGSGGYGGGENNGNGGAGGSVTINTSKLTKYDSSTGGRGGGEDCGASGDAYSTRIYAVSFEPTSGTNCGSFTFSTQKSNDNYDDLNYTLNAPGVQGWVSGGCSYGYGYQFQDGPSTGRGAGIGGGGGMTSSNNDGYSNGKPGGAILFY